MTAEEIKKLKQTVAYFGHWYYVIGEENVAILEKAVAEIEANEWHYVQDGNLPKECEDVWCYCIGPGIKYCCAGHIIVNGDNKVKWWANNKSEQLRVIAWKEIILPELKELSNAVTCM